MTNKINKAAPVLLKEIGRGKWKEKITNIWYERAVVLKAKTIDITKTIARYYYELYANEMKKIEEMDKTQLKNKRK